MDPDNKLRHANADRAEILAELYVMGGVRSRRQGDRAARAHVCAASRSTTTRTRHSRASTRTRTSTTSTGASAPRFQFLSRADAEEQQFADQYKPRGFAKAKHVMSPASWAKLAHSDENRYISAVLGACSRGVAMLKAFPHKDFDLKREDRRPLEGDPLMFSKLFLYLANVLNVPVPDVYLVDDDKTVDIQLANTIEKHELCPSFVVRPHVLQGKTEREIAFLLTRRLAFMRPEYYLRMLLADAHRAKGRRAVGDRDAAAELPGPPRTWSRQFNSTCPRCGKRMPPQALEQLGALVQHFIQATPENQTSRSGDMPSTRFAHRAGFVIVRRFFEVAARAVVAEPIRDRWSDEQGQGQAARAVLGQRGVFRRPRTDGAKDRRLNCRARLRPPRFAQRNVSSSRDCADGS